MSDTTDVEPQPPQDAPPSEEAVEKDLEKGLAEVLRGEKTFAEILGIEGEHAYQLATMGYKLLQEGNYADAETIFRGLVRLNPKDANMHMWLGSTLHRKGEIQPAIEAYNAALQLDPESAACLANRGELLIVDGKAEDGTKDLMRAIELDPEAKEPATVRARAILATIAQKLQEKGEA